MKIMASTLRASNLTYNFILMLHAVDDKEWVELDMSEPDATLEDNYIFDGSVVTFEEKKIKKQ